MKTILVLPNPTKKESCDFANSLKKKLLQNGFNANIGTDGLKDSPNLAVIVGGDGTVLRYLETVLDYSVPVLGVNFGHRGYLTSCEPDEKQAVSIINEIFENKESANRRFETRILFECEILSEERQILKKIIGLNEAVVSRGGLCKAVDFNLYINQSPVISFPADGIIVATPTGSTAYNFSAQGPVLMPEAKNLVITPICASSLMRSSIVTSDSDVIEIGMSSERRLESDETPTLISDGYKKFRVNFDERIVIRKSEKTLKIYGGENGEFLRILERKMNN